jgi:hypothetical protein
MLKIFIVCLSILLVQGCSISYNTEVKSELSEKDRSALMICGIGYEYENGTYISQIEKQIIDNAVKHKEISEVEILMLKEYSECMSKLK